MKNLKLTIDLLPKGAWGKDFSITLPKKDWDRLRYATYEAAEYQCEICGTKPETLEAHEVWNFDIPSQTQTLVEIKALCPACHGVKHFRNSVRIGYGEQAKHHFMKVNDCGLDTLTKHYLEVESLFEQRNQVRQWEMKAPLLDELGINY